mmetsp:Transcript_5574/g.13550  ORF Transcript_5574/g.13550 Transcript_5574/m.13550 type:complete len:86 (-) Transcript_5574:568-825(-)
MTVTVEALDLTNGRTTRTTRTLGQASMEAGLWLWTPSQMTESTSMQSLHRDQSRCINQCGSAPSPDDMAKEATAATVFASTLQQQ